VSAGWVTATLKALRGLPPLNAVATGMVRAAMRASGRESGWAVRHLHRVGAVRAPLPNGRTLRLWSRGDDWVSNQVYWRGWAGYEPETSRPFFELAARARVTLDVGAFVGYYALLAGHANPDGSVYAFEPMPGPFERLQRHILLNRLRNVHALPLAAGARAACLDLVHLAGVALPTSSSLSGAFMEGAGALQRTPVQVVALDAFLRERGLAGVDLVKLDTETTEPDVLSGLRETLERDRPAIVCEVLAGQGTAAALEQRLAGLGYGYYLLTPHGSEAREHIEPHPRWLNHLFLAPRHGSAP
jgi:FkbM family methyltransferase